MKKLASIVAFTAVLMLLRSAHSLAVPGGFEDLTLEVRAESDVPSATAMAFPMQAVPLILTLSNRTEHSVAGHDAIEPDAGMVEFQIAPGGGKFVGFGLGNYPIPFVSINQVEIAPRYSKSCRVVLWCGQRQHRGIGEALFPEPGEYLVKASLKMVGKPQFIESNVLPVTLIQPSGEEYDAWMLLREKTEENVAKSDPPGVAIPFTRPQRCDPSSWRWKLYADVIEHFPGTSYADYARYTIGMRCSAEDESALGLLEEVAGKHGFPMRDEVLHHLVNPHVRKRNITRARVYCSELLLSYPESHLTKSAMGRVHRGAREQ